MAANSSKASAHAPRRHPVAQTSGIIFIKARALIEECGYGRRLAELTDAEARLVNCR
jgi:hypothetical protein